MNARLPSNLMSGGTSIKNSDFTEAISARGNRLLYTRGMCRRRTLGRGMMVIFRLCNTSLLEKGHNIARNYLDIVSITSSSSAPRLSYLTVCLSASVGMTATQALVMWFSPRLRLILHWLMSFEKALIVFGGVTQLGCLASEIISADNVSAM